MCKWLGLAVAVALAAVPAFAGKVAVVLDVRGRGDLSYNDMGFKGTDRAAVVFGLEIVQVQNATAADYLPNLRNLAWSREYDLIICVGFLLGDALQQTAEEFPNQKFAIIDWVVIAPNVMSVVFRENEMSALVGALAAMAAAHHGYPKAGVVLGIEIPVLYNLEAGFRFGMAWGNWKYAAVTGKPDDVGILYTYTGSFSAIALGYSTTVSMLGQGAVGVYNGASALGLGIRNAITDCHRSRGSWPGPPYYFGGDVNQDWMARGMHGLASGMKRVDVGCYMAVEAVVKGTFKGGVVSLGLKERGVGISRYEDLLEFIEFGIAAGALKPEDREETIRNWRANRATLPDWIWAAIDELEAGIIAGTIVVPVAWTVDEMRVIRALYPLGAP